MKKTSVLRGSKKFLAVNLVCSLLVAGCGMGGAADDGVSFSAVSPEGENGTVGGSGEGQSGGSGNPVSDPMGRQVLTVVITTSSSDILNKITAFNASSPDYFIEKKSYGTGVNAFEELETQLPLEILSGAGPDMVIWDQMYYSPALTSERLMEDLYAYMDTDPDFHKEDYYENIMEAFEVNGGLYLCPASFSVDTGCVRAEELEAGRGVTESWSLEEMIEAYENSPRAKTFATNFTKTLQLRIISEDCMGNFVDWGSGECHFDSPEFVGLLEWCNTFPEEFQDHITYEGRAILDGMKNGQIFWKTAQMFEPWTVAYMRTISGDADLLWPGHPVADGEKEMGGGVAVPCGACYSICKNSSNPEAAWEVIKSFLTEDMQREVRGIPLLKSVSEEKIQDALTLEYEMVNGVQQEKIKYDSMFVIMEGVEEIFKFSCITEDDAEVYRSIIESTHRSYGGNPEILNIIMEEAGAYFGGDKDAATVADIIQNRVRIYVGERVK